MLIFYTFYIATMLFVDCLVNVSYQTPDVKLLHLVLGFLFRQISNIYILQ